MIYIGEQRTYINRRGKTRDRSIEYRISKHKVSSKVMVHISKADLALDNIENDQHHCQKSKIIPVNRLTISV